eukprot:TRINITY_DN3915_c0_g1_i2.p1 TRINITY_DN3915_c0_g1~~TRINITY_DN3915_c0_g1_i2.p1  ORF type:complete len:159 (-),score=23.56 TRINITY_DN3915_c0_g1_i2:26-502(-)
MTPYINKLKVGDTLNYAIIPNVFQFPSGIKVIGMIAGGTGIAPMINIIRHYLSVGGVELRLIFSNVVVEDILLKDELLEWSSKHHEQLKVHFTLTGGNQPEDWKGGVGRCNKEMIREQIGSPSPSTYVLVCGPIRMTNDVVVALREDGFSTDRIHAFV